MSDPYNNSLNSLLGSFTYTTKNNFDSIDNPFLESICIDTSNNRLGINTLDPSYSIHIMDGKIDNVTDYSGNLYVSEFICLSANINEINTSKIDVSSINFKSIISGPSLDVSNIDVSSIFFKDIISGETLDVSSIININTISGINLLFDVSKIDISGTIDLSYAEFKPKFFIPDTSAGLERNQLYYDMSGTDAGILMIKLS